MFLFMKNLTKFNVFFDFLMTHSKSRFELNNIFATDQPMFTKELPKLVC